MCDLSVFPIVTKLFCRSSFWIILTLKHERSAPPFSLLGSIQQAIHMITLLQGKCRGQCKSGGFCGSRLLEDKASSVTEL